MRGKRGRCIGAVLSMVALAAVVVSPARAHVVHTVEPGESLWSIAEIDGLDPAALAAANGLSPDAQLIAGSSLVIPPQSGSSSGAADSGEDSSSSGSGTGTGSYLVRWGDTLSGIAVSAGVSTEELAAANGLSVNGVLVQGTSLTIPGGGGESTASSSSDGDAPVATAETVSPGQISDQATSHGVPPALSTAVAWQESGFQNGVVSSSDARGVMQIIPGTWDFIQDELAVRPLDPASADENVHAGVMYLGYLLNQSGGDPETAVAGYYQGLGSVQRDGMLPATRRYVANVMALRDRFAGG